MAPALRAVSGLGRLCSALHSRSTKAKNGTCGLDVDECLSKPCANGATCSAGRDAYTCKCTAGYSGKKCDVDIDDCAPRPCRNGGQCLDAVGPSSPEPFLCCLGLCSTHTQHRRFHSESRYCCGKST